MSTSSHNGTLGSDAHPYLKQFDGIRAIAIIFVLIQHFVPSLLQWGPLLPWGDLGVQMLITMSGYLITANLLSSKREVEAGRLPVGRGVWRFYVRRFLRIWPIYYLTILGAAVTGISAVRDALWWHLAYATNILFAVQGDWHHPIEHIWTLAVLQQFYWIWPWLMFLTPRRYLVRAMVIIAFCGPAYRLAVILLGANRFTVLYQFTSCLDGIGLGALLAVILERNSGSLSLRRFSRWAGPFALVVFLALQPDRYYEWHLTFYRTVAYSLMAVMFLSVLVKARDGFGGIAGALLSSRPLVFLGKVSYGIYLYHNFLPKLFITASMKWGFPSLPESDVLRFAILTVTSFLLSVVSWRLIEIPANRLKKYFPYTA